MDWLTHLGLYGRVKLALDVRNARPAFRLARVVGPPLPKPAAALDATEED